MKKYYINSLAVLCVIIIIVSTLGGCSEMDNNKFSAFKNKYVIPENTLPYAQLDTTQKTDWNASWIWNSNDSSKENVWMCFRKKAYISTVPQQLNAYISCDSKYWLYINGETVVFEGGVKRGPSDDSCYYDTVNIAPYLHQGENVICALVWYWGKDTSYSSTDSGKGGFIFEAESDGIPIISDSSWKVCKNTAYKIDEGETQPNYRLPEYNIYYDATREIGSWTSLDFDDTKWENATAYGAGGVSPWGKLFPRGIPMLKDYGLKNYENSKEYENYEVKIFNKEITVDIPYNAQCTPYLKVSAPAGKVIKITTENTDIGAVSDTYITKDGEQEFEALGWFNGEHITYEIPAGVTIIELKYRETGYNTEFAGSFESSNEELNSLWQKSLRTLYVTMRDNYMDCPDRERAQWWGDVTNEMAMSMYCMDTNSYLLYQKGVNTMINHIDPTTNVLQTVVPISQDYFELPAQQLAGICGFWTYYMYTGDEDFISRVYEPALKYLDLWNIGKDGLVEHRAGSWDWMDWGENADVEAIENAWYYYALSSVKNMAELLNHQSDFKLIITKMERIHSGYQNLWTDSGYKSSSMEKPDDRANALAILSGLADSDKYTTIANVLSEIYNSSPYMEYYVLSALCEMERSDLAQSRMTERYSAMIKKDYSTLWEGWTEDDGTLNHAWSGGPLVIMSKYIAGIRPTKPGYAEFSIKPQLSNLTSVECTVPSVKGYIKVNESCSENGFNLHAELPEETTAVVYLPYT